MNIVGLIPARGGSKGIPRKNVRLLGGKPLIAYTIETALRSKLLDRVIVSTDDREIAKIAKKYGAEVPFMRPPELAGDNIPDFPVIEHALKWLDTHSRKTDYFVFLRPTNIFRTAKDIDNAIKKILKSKDFDSIRAISSVAYPPYWMKKVSGNRLVPFLKTKYAETRRQELPKIYQGNGTIEVIKRQTILNKKTRFGKKIGYYIMDEIAAIDIDTELDLKIAEILYPLWINGRVK